MRKTVPLLRKIASENRVVAISVDGEGKNPVIAEKNRLFDENGNEFECEGISGIEHLKNGDLIVSHKDGITCLQKFKPVWNFQCETGAENLFSDGLNIVFSDALGKCYVIDHQGNLLFMPDNQSTLFISLGPQLAIADESGEVSLWSWSGEKTWQRPARGDIGERITAIGWNNDAIIIAREGHGLVPGEEEAIEVECWRDGKLVERSEPKGRVVAIDGVWLGLDMGGVQYYDKLAAELQHPVKKIIDGGDRALLASWFHIYMINGDEIVWSVEHQGMVEMIAVNDDWSVVMVAGEDQNDWTESEPVIILDANAEAESVALVKNEVDDWAEAPPIEIDAASLYDEKDDAFEALMAEEKVTSKSNAKDMSVLLDALEDQLSALEEDTKSINEDENLDLALHDINLLEDLDSEVEEYIAPVANSGNDITTQSDENGVAMVILDGSETYDPQSRVSSWQWINALGKEVAQSSKVKIKLNKGVHRFELRVKDSEGSWTSDALTVTIE